MRRHRRRVCKHMQSLCGQRFPALEFKRPLRLHGAMNKNDIDRHHGAPSGVRDRIVDWLGAQGPLLLTIYMCSVVALVAFFADATR